MISLKPCPFCGGKAEVRFSGSRYQDFVRGYFVVSCNICRATVRGRFYQGDTLDNLPYGLEETKGAHPAIVNWNMRKGEADEHTQ